MVYVLFRDVYGKAPEYCGVFSSTKEANKHKRVLEKQEEATYGYSSDYIVQPTRLDSGE